MKEPKKTVILLLLLLLGIATFFWGRWRLKNQLGEGLNTSQGAQTQTQQSVPSEAQ